MGGSGARFSHHKKATAVTTATTNGPSTTGDANDADSLSVRPKTSPTMARQSRAEPARSTRVPACPARSLGTADSVATTQAAASGTLTSRTSRQLTADVRAPPIVGPRAPAIAETPPIVPRALPRSCAGKVALTMATLPGSINAPPRPWTTRAPSSGQQARIEDPFHRLRGHAELAQDRRERERHRRLVNQDDGVSEDHR